MRKIVVLENIRSAYNCGNIIRTADALGREVWLTGYTPHPDEQSKVKKTSLGAEEHVGLRRFDYSKDAIAYARENNLAVLAGEITENALPVSDVCKKLGSHINESEGLILILGNEVDGVLSSTLKSVDQIVYIPMQGIKESLNVGQSSAILMRELGKLVVK